MRSHIRSQAQGKSTLTCSGKIAYSLGQPMRPHDRRLAWCVWVLVAHATKALTYYFLGGQPPFTLMLVPVCIFKLQGAPYSC